MIQKTEWEKGYDLGYADGYHNGYYDAMKATWKEHYEKLCNEIREDERNKIVKVLKEYYDVR